MSQHLKDTYNLIAEDWHRDHQKDDWWVAGTNKFISLVPPGGRVLDVGCGSGVKAQYLIKHGLKVAGVDLSEQMIEIAKREVPQGNFLVGDMRDVGQLTENFDAIFMQASLLHIPRSEAPEILAKMVKKLKTGGYIYVAVKAWVPGSPAEEVEVEDDYGYKYERFFSYYTVEEIKNFMTDLGLEICYDEVASSGKRPWVQVIAQK